MTSIEEVVHELAGASAESILMPGCTEEQISAFESASGWSMPVDLKNVYFQSDGENPDWGGHDGKAGILGGFVFIPLREVAREVEKLKSIAEYFSNDRGCSLESIPENRIQTEFYIDGWFPFASDGGGSYLAVDMDPAIDGLIGQVVVIGNSDKYYVVADSVAEFLEILISKYRLNRMNERFFERKPSDSSSDRSLSSWLEQKYQ